jgi:hypothetical protein
MGVPKLTGRWIWVTTREVAYAGRVISVDEAGYIFPHHELYIVFEWLVKLGEKGREDVKGNFGGVKDLFVGRKWNKVYSLDGNYEYILKSIADKRRVTPEIESGLRCVYPD